MQVAKKEVSESLAKRPKITLAEILPVSERITNFPSTRYYGSKRKLLSWIFENIKSLKFNSVLDGFGGTGSVSLLFKAMGKDLTYHDGFLFNIHVGTTVLSNDLSVSRELFSKFIDETIPERGLIHKTFRDLYFLDTENCWLDGFAEKLFSSQLNDQQRSLFLYTLFQACLKKRPFNLFHRTNLGLRLNRTVTRRFGNSTTWERPFRELMIKSYDEIAKSIWQGRAKVRILKPANILDLEPGYDLVYFDPPYINPIDHYNADDYWSKYHFLEGLSCYPSWHKWLDTKSYLKVRGTPKRLAGWNQKTTFTKRLFQLIEKHRKSIIVLSYVAGSYPHEDNIVETFRKLFSHVSVHSKEHGHVLSKTKRTELLFIGRP